MSNMIYYKDPVKAILNCFVSVIIYDESRGVEYSVCTYDLDDINKNYSETKDKSINDLDITIKQHYKNNYTNTLISKHFLEPTEEVTILGHTKTERELLIHHQDIGQFLLDLNAVSLNDDETINSIHDYINNHDSIAEEAKKSLKTFSKIKKTTKFKI